VIYIDANILIYLLEDHGEKSLFIADTLDEFRAKQQPFLTSVITITEFLAGTRTLNRDTLGTISGLGFQIVDETIAESAARLQRDKNLKIGDAVHLATAIQNNAAVFFTNDRQLAKAASQYLEVKTLSMVV